LYSTGSDNSELDNLIEEFQKAEKILWL
jgi:hypothetical protein